ncbi:tolloid-like protein 1 [Seriola dumerili]|uniref:Tolloid-like protein 1 n=1 Tax=Seriola dumerili TaxID=41447 RepID=A0A3B4TMU9_SERDU|nr:tolloid-like protein 1 [Seriola dumerili]
MARRGLLLLLFSHLFLEALAAIDTCGDNITLNSAAFFITPGFPMVYLPSQQCVWVITTPEPDQKILLNFNSIFHLEGKDCKHDYVEVYNGGDELSPLLGRYCGSVAPRPFITSGNQVLIKFISDDENDGAGFAVHYEVFKLGPDCSRNFTDPQGVITTPDFPKNYPNNLDCTLMIFAPQQKSEIVLEFNSFSMEPHSFHTDPDNSCKYDWLEIWDGLPAVGSHIGKYCGSSSPGRVISHSGILSMIVITDNQLTKEGFSANYTIHNRSPKYTCGSNLQIDSGSYLTTSGFPYEYLPSQHCVWVLTALEPGHKIILSFNPYFNLEGKDCKHDYVEVYDGGDELSPLLGRYCGTVAPSPIITSGNQVLIKFISDDEVQEAGFSVVYKLFKPGPKCSRNFTDPQGVITTPNFPKKYPENMNCSLMIFAPQEKSEIVLEFNSFDMEPDFLHKDPDNPCTYDWLEIWDGLPAVGSYIGKYCGWTPPDQVISQSGILSMIVITDKAINRSGFSANYTIRERMD